LLWWNRIDELADDVEDRRFERHPRVERIVVGRILDPPQDRRRGGVPRIEIEDRVAPRDVARALDERVGRAAERLDALAVDQTGHRQVAVAPIRGDLLLGEMTRRRGRGRHRPSSGMIEYSLR